MKCFFVFLGLIAFSASTSSAGYIVNIAEVGSAVVATGSGTLDTTSLPNFGTFLGSSTSGMGPSVGLIQVGDSTPAALNIFIPNVLFTGPSSFGTGTSFLATSGTGNRVELFGSSGLGIDQGYVSGSALSSTATWANHSFTSLGITPGTYTWTWGGGGTADFFTINATISAVPEPSSVGLVGLALVTLFARRKRSKCRQTCVNQPH